MRQFFSYYSPVTQAPVPTPIPSSPPASAPSAPAPVPSLDDSKPLEQLSLWEKQQVKLGFDMAVDHIKQGILRLPQSCTLAYALGYRLALQRFKPQAYAQLIAESA